jgi:hypothetical protein
MPLYATTPASFDPAVLIRSTTPRVCAIDRMICTGSPGMASGRANFVGFTPAAGATVSTLSVAVRGTAAATITLARLGLFTVAADGALTLVARTAASTTLGNGTFTLASAALDTTGGYPASYTVAAGQRYAFGCLWVATTAPTLYGSTSLPSICAWLPWAAMFITGQTDLAASYTFASLSASGDLPFLAAS